MTKIIEIRIKSMRARAVRAPCHFALQQAELDAHLKHLAPISRTDFPSLLLTALVIKLPTIDHFIQVDLHDEHSLRLVKLVFLILKKPRPARRELKARSQPWFCTGIQSSWRLKAAPRGLG